MVKKLEHQDEEAPKAGSSSIPDGPAYLAVGFLRRPHGVLGEIAMDVLTDFPERLKEGMQVYAGEEREALTILSIRPRAAGVIIAFKGFNDRDTVGRLRNTAVYVPTAGLPALADGEYYHHELLGLQVVTEAGEKVGRLVEILETGANDVYVIQPESGKEILLPAIDDVILHVDLEQKIMQVRPQNWS